MDSGYGALYLVATPIGNLEDITYRAVRVLSEADIIAAEDTRRTLRLLNHLGIKKQLISYHDNNRISRAGELIARLKEGKSIALVSDAGTPAVSDPGEELVRLCVAENIPVTAVPGCSAAITGLVLSGLPTGRFAFEGFLPAKRTERIKRLKGLIGEERTMIFYEGPHRVPDMLSDALEILGDRPCAAARELTKLHEEVLRGSLSGMLAHFREWEPKGEFVIIISGAEKKPGDENTFDDLSLEEHVRLYVEQGLGKMDAIKQAAKDRGLSKRDVYQALNRD
jgi:16S rRNA (cytidine1402-2'-O)-methyltransferase